MDCKFCDQSGFQDIIAETDHWTAFLNRFQAYPGRSIVVLKRHALSLAELTEEEWGNFRALAKQLESATAEGLGATMHNWTCLMNHGYLTDPPNPHVHWHFRPRYAQPVEFAGEKFEDQDFGHHYTDNDSHFIETPRLASPAARQEIIDRIKRHL
jgi:diadenosine tetraphosphate (Ap4A) HIT family hydrolase